MRLKLSNPPCPKRKTFVGACQFFGNVFVHTNSARLGVYCESHKNTPSGFGLDLPSHNERPPLEIIFLKYPKIYPHTPSLPPRFNQAAGHIEHLLSHCQQAQVAVLQQY